jgi:hypothetical protein
MNKTLVGAMAVLAVVGAGVSGCASNARIASVSASGGGQGVADGKAGKVLPAEAATSASRQPTGYAFSTHNDPADPTFNQLLGINSRGTIAGYFGSGAQGHPNQGYLL